MKRPPISDAQMDLLATRLAAAGVGRRDFLRVAAGLAAMGAARFNARPAEDFVWSWKRQMDPASKNPYSSYFYDIKGDEACNKSKVPDASQVGVQAKGDWTLEVTLEGPRGYFPVLSAYLAALPAHRGAVEKHGDKWTEAANIVCNGPFTLEAWEHNKVMALRKNKHFIGAKDVTLDKVTIPITSVQSGALPYEGNELDMTSLQTGDLKRLRVDPRTAKQVFRYPFPGTWYL